MLASVSIGDAFDVLVIVLLWRRDGQSGMSGLPKLGLACIIREELTRDKFFG